MKRICLLLSIICICLFTCSCSSYSPITDFEYEYKDGTVTITKYIGSSLDINVPKIIDERPVTTIGEGAFKDYDMNSVILPETITTIQKDAFRGCSQLENIELPNSITDIDVLWGIEDTNWYEMQPDGVIYLDSILIGFKGADKEDLSSLEIQDGTRVILDEAFTDFTNLSKVTIPNTVEIVGDSAFFNTKISQVNIPESVAEIGSIAFCYHIASKITVSKPGGPKTVVHTTNGVIEGSVIYGKAGTKAEIYANENDILFIEE